MRVAGALRITPEEMEELPQYLIAQDPEVMAGELGEAAALWAKEVRTAGILWLALPAPDGGCRQGRWLKVGRTILAAAHHCSGCSPL